MIKLLHFADAHIDMAMHGKRDAESGLPIRVLDFLKALDTIVSSAISEKVDLVIFAGDAYKDRTPSPTFQREWGKRIMRLSNASIPTLLLVGNHDMSPAVGRANTLHEFNTLEVPNIKVLNKPDFLKPADLWGLPLQVLSIPWVFRSGLMANLDSIPGEIKNINEEIERKLNNILSGWMDDLDPTLPTILTAHGSVQGALYGNERTVMLGNDLLLPGALVKDPRLDYVALGHIHKHQNLNPGAHPPVIYSGSIERVDFGEAMDEKVFVIAEVGKGKTTFKTHPLNGRRFIDLFVKIKNEDQMMEKIYASLPADSKVTDAIVRLTVEYPRELDVFLEEIELRKKCEKAFEFHLIRRPQEEARLRLPVDQSIGSLTPFELMDSYWKTIWTDPPDLLPLNKLAGSIIQSVTGGSENMEEPGGMNA
jgi:DNA repair protein SbcD/Mre11